jgi:3',5'-nucleoside bisphosphate phosphatase
MSGRVDLHVHSDRSCDGDFSPAELVRMAADIGLRALSITDHDSVAAYPEAVAFGKEAGVEVIPGMEITTLYDEREFHLLLPFVDWTREAVFRIVDHMSVAREREARERVSRLQELGLPLTWEEVRAVTDGVPPLGVKIAQILLDKPESAADPRLAAYFKSDRRPYAPYHFYQDYFAEGKPAYVSKNHIALVDVLALAPATGGVPVLAHPGAYFQSTTREDLQALKEAGLAGLEVYTTYHTPDQTALFRDLAGEFDLVATAGSDFHGRIKPRVVLGGVKEGVYGMVEALRERRTAP